MRPPPTIPPAMRKTPIEASINPGAIVALERQRPSAGELAIDAAVPRPEPANGPPPTASDFKIDTTASTTDAAKTTSPSTAAPSTTAKAPDPKPAEIVTAPDSKPAEAPKNETKNE